MCVYCDIVARKLPADVVLETDSIIAFRDIHPVAPVHVLIIPKKHIKSTNELTPDDAELIVEMTMAAQSIAIDEGISDSGYRVIFNTGPDAGEIPHLHWHVIGGKKLKWEF